MWWNRLKKTLSRHVCEYAMPPALKSGPLDQFTNTHINAIQYYTICILKCLILPCLELDWFDQIYWYLVKVLSRDYVKLYFMLFFSPINYKALFPHKGETIQTRIFAHTMDTFFYRRSNQFQPIPVLYTPKTNAAIMDNYFTANNNYTIDFFMKKQHYKKHCFVTTFYTYFP